MFRASIQSIRHRHPSLLALVVAFSMVCVPQAAFAFRTPSTLLLLLMNCGKDDDKKAYEECQIDLETTEEDLAECETESDVKSTTITTLQTHLTETQILLGECEIDRDELETELGTAESELGICAAELGTYVGQYEVTLTRTLSFNSVNAIKAIRSASYYLPSLGGQLTTSEAMDVINRLEAANGGLRFTFEPAAEDDLESFVDYLNSDGNIAAKSIALSELINAKIADLCDEMESL